MKSRYFRSDGYWTFADKNAELVKPTSMRITRYVKASGRNSPYDPKILAGANKASGRPTDVLARAIGIAVTVQLPLWNVPPAIWNR